MGIRLCLSSWCGPGTSRGWARRSARGVLPRSLYLVEDLDLEEAALLVAFEEDGLGAHLHAERGGGEMFHLHHGAHARAARRQMRLHGRVAGELHEVDHERGGEHAHAVIAEGVRGQLGHDHLLDLRGESGRERHGPSSTRLMGGRQSLGRILGAMPVVLAAAAFLLVGLDGSVNIAFPAMSAAFGVDPTVIRWVIICYVGTYAFTAFAAGVLADRLGPGRVVRAGLVLSLLCFACYVVAPSFSVFLFLRVLQGASGGLLYGASPALVTLSLPASRRGWGLGWASAGLGLGLSVSPLIGGALVAAFGWRGVFLFRIPIAAAFIVLAGWTSTPRATPRGAWRMIEPGEILRWPVLHAGSLAFLANFAQFSVWLLAPYYLVSQ